MNEEKRCNRCGVTKAKSEFPIHRRRSGYAFTGAYCHPCEKARKAESQKANRPRANSNYKRWVAAHPFQARITVMERQARYQWKKAGLHVEKFSYFTVLERDGWTCSICGEHVEECALSFDHVIPKSAGGAHALANVRVAHIRCNDSKAGKTAATARWMSRKTDHQACHNPKCVKHSTNKEC